MAERRARRRWVARRARRRQPRRPAPAGGMFGGALVLWGAPIALVGVWPLAAGHSCAWGSWESATRCSTSRVSRSSSGRRRASARTSVRGLRDRSRPAIGRRLGARLDPGRPAGDPLGARGVRRVSPGGRPPRAPTAARDRRRPPRCPRASGARRRRAAFPPLPVTTLERLAARPKARASAGEQSSEGRHGRRFYVIASGEINVIRDDETRPC